MRNTPILIPIILVVCLGTMAYLLFAAFKSNAALDLPRVEATLGEPVPYEPLAPAPNTYDDQNKITSAAGDDPDLDRYYQDIPEDEKVYPKTYAADRPVFTADEEVSNDWDGNEVARDILADKSGRYVVLAGSFRQRANAESQVKKLRKAGFAESEVNLSTGGAYAMAFVGRRDTEQEANDLVATLKQKGFDARVVSR